MGASRIFKHLLLVCCFLSVFTLYNVAWAGDAEEAINIKVIEVSGNRRIETSTIL